jgi:Methyltransferase domain
VSLNLQSISFEAGICIPRPFVDDSFYENQFLFQHRYSVGKILNVGCDNDGAMLGRRPGAVNIDLHRVSKITGNTNPVHVLADGRRLPFSNAKFDTVVLGEILEHLTDLDAIQCLKEARAMLKPGPQSRVIVTMPHDQREREAQGYGELRYFAEGIPVHHPRHIGRPELVGWTEKAEFRIAVVAGIDYIWGQKGTGLVLTI